MRSYAVTFLAALLAACATAPRPAPSKDDIRARAAGSFEKLEEESRPAAQEPRAKPAPAAQTAPKAAPPPSEAQSAPVDDPEIKVLREDPAKGCTWIETKASVLFGDTEAKNQAEARATSQAISRAMADFLGQEITHNTIDYEQESLKNQARLTESLLRVTQPGLELARKVLSSGPEDIPGCKGCRYGVLLQTCIAPRKSSSDTNFRTEISLNRTAFKDGDEAEAQITCTSDAYLYLYNVDLQANATLIFPSEYDSKNMIRAGETVVFPSAELKRKTGAKFTAALPPGLSVSAEVLRVIATKSPLPKTILEGGAANRGTQATSEGQGGSLLGLMQRLNASGIEWAEDVQAFTISKQ